MDRVYTASELQVSEPDRYIATLYAPAPLRDDVLALYAFDLEIRSLRDRVSEALPAEVRIQWWRDVLDAGQVTGHPLADRLVAAMARHRLPFEAFERYLDARIFDLYDDPMPDRTTLEAYCGETGGTILQLACMILSPADARAAADACGHGGCADTLTRLVWSMSRWHSRGQCYVPAEMLSAAGLDAHAFASGKAGERAATVASMMIALARAHLDRFAAAAAQTPASLRPAFLPLAVCSARLDAAQRLGGALLAQEPAMSPVRRHWLIWRRALRGWG